MKYLVTGGAGFVGSHVVEGLLGQQQEVVVIDNFDETLRSSSSRQQWWQKMNAVNNLSLVSADLTQHQLDELLVGVDVVIHQAATPGLVPSWLSFDRYLRNNVLATQLLAEAVCRSNVKRVVHASTSSVYGLTAIGDESLPTKPISPYGISKLASELIWAAHAGEIGCPVTVLRYFSVYGPRQRTDMAWSIFIGRLMSDQGIQMTGDGKQSRTATYVVDAARATIAAASPDSTPGVYNICGDEEISVIDALGLIAGFVGVKPEIEFIPSRKGDQAQTQGNNTAAKEALGFSNLTSLKEGIAAQVSWAKQHRYW